MKDWKFLFEKYIQGKHKHGFPEPEVLKQLSKIYGDLFVDIGANLGIYSMALARNFDRIYAFEPNADVKGMLIQNLSSMRFARNTIFPIALSDKKEKRMFYRDHHKGFNGSADTILPVFEYKPSGTGLPDNTYIGKEGVEIETDTYDNLIRDSADLVKIDTEGAEFLVLEGMKHSFSQKRVRRIMVELHNREHKTELENLLTENGFVTRWLDPDRIYGELESVSEYRTV